MPFSAKLNIAGVVFEVICRERRPVTSLSDHYPAFLTTRAPRVRVICEIAKKWRPADASASAVKAIRQGDAFFYRAELFDAVINNDFRMARFVSAGDTDIIVQLRFLCSIMLAQRGGCLLHSCAVLDDGFSYVFFGESGSGKTTIAGLSEGRVVLTDETAALIRNSGSWYAYATPFAGEFGQPQRNAGGPVKAMFALNKDTRFRRRMFKPAGAVRALSRSTLLNNGDYGMINNTLGTLELLAREVPCYELYFRAQPQLWRYINGFAG